MKKENSMKDQSNDNPNNKSTKAFTIPITDLVTKVNSIGLDRFKYKSFWFENTDDSKLNLCARIGITNFWKKYDIIIAAPLLILFILLLLSTPISDALNALGITPPNIDVCYTNINHCNSQFAVKLTELIIGYFMLLPILFIISVIGSLMSIGKKSYCLLDNDEVSFTVGKEPEFDDKDVKKHPLQECKLSLKKSFFFRYTMSLTGPDYKHIMTENVSRKDAQNFLALLDNQDQT